MKVLFAGSTFPRRYDDTLPDFMWRQVRWMARVTPGLSAFVLAPHDASAATRETWDGVQVRRFRYLVPAALQRLVYPAIWPNLRRNPLLILQVPLLLVAEFFATLRWARRERFDLVYSHWFMPQGVACGLAALATGTPHAFTTHSSDVAVMRRLPFIGPWLVRFLVRRARAITAVSTRSRDIVASFFTSAEWERLSPKVAVIPMGVDPTEWRDIPAGSPNELLFIGRLAAKKGVEYLLQAMTVEPLRSMDARLTVAGDGPLLEMLRARSSALGLADRVRFTGFVSGQPKRECFARAGTVVISSIITDAGDAEGLPVVLLEALAAGRTVVATDASGAPDVVSDDSALVVPQKDAAALATAIARAIAMPEHERRAMRERARAVAARHDWDAVARAHVRHLLPAS
ncbi:MAG: glycosyltransferase [Gemmatimonadaceae bacterium]